MEKERAHRGARSRVGEPHLQRAFTIQLGGISRISFCCGALPCSRSVTRGSFKHPRGVCDHFGPNFCAEICLTARVTVLSVRLSRRGELSARTEVGSASLCFSGGNKQTRVCAEQLFSARRDGFLLSRHQDVTTSAVQEALKGSKESDFGKARGRCALSKLVCGASQTSYLCNNVTFLNKNKSRNYTHV